MKERPVILNGEMVRAILDGRKTQTRRIAKADNSNHLLGCPFGQAGDRLWVRETFAILGNEDGCPIDWDGNLIKGDEKHAARIYKASCWQEPGNYGLWSIPDRDTQYEGAWRPPIHMPRWASRITLEITAVRVERLNDISHDDAKAEGCCYGRGGGVPDFAVTPADHFPTLWASIYGAESWRANPWVWVIEFKRAEAQEKAL
ncbi:hypothetical protein [Serratia sp. TKO39]|uniref:hypothetical protein n=1 Tax=Serratia sp. TKO39 TaxID=2052589 RepID=UPI000C2312B0|nr:hypothetical protein [Serratia sp. TKO39]PJI66995.1 hypothetical protein CUN64_17430 [Serratia sp. TKO39]